MGRRVVSCSSLDATEIARVSLKMHNFHFDVGPGGTCNVIGLTLSERLNGKKCNRISMYL
jgi:hypothetical protein